MINRSEKQEFESRVLQARDLQLINSTEEKEEIGVNGFHVALYRFSGH